MDNRCRCWTAAAFRDDTGDFGELCARSATGISLCFDVHDGVGHGTFLVEWRTECGYPLDACGQRANGRRSLLVFLSMCSSYH